MTAISASVSILLGLLAAPPGADAQRDGGAALAPYAAAIEAAAAPSAKPPIVEITKTCPNLRYVGRDATFEITVSNRGEGAASNVVVTDAIAGGTQFLSADNGGTQEGGNVVWRIGTLGPNESRSLKATVRCAQITTVRNTATVTYCAEIAAGCEFEVKGIPAILLECVDDPDPIEIGSNVTYTIVVTNQGTAVGTNIVIACTLPAEEEFVSAAGPTNGTGSGKSVKFEPLATLAPAAKAVYKVTVKGIAVGDVRFGVQLTSDQVTSPVTETESTHVY